MKKSLRRKFILFAMSAVTILLLLLILSINGINGYITNRQINNTMDMLVNSNGKFGFMDFRPMPRPEHLPFMEPLNMDQMRSVRFFIVQINSNGEIDEVNIDEIFSVSDEQAKEYAEKIFQNGSGSGTIDHFKYAVKLIENNEQLIFFMDTSRQQESVLRVLFVSIIIAVISWLIVLIFAFFISGKVVQPIIAGMEKQKRFITDAGHELKTPLAIIQSNNDANILINGENKYTRNIKSQVIRLGELTSNLLTLAKLDEEVPMLLEALDISSIAEGLVSTYQETAENKNLDLKYQIEKGIYYVTNKEAFTKLITILLDNALKYTSESGNICFTLKQAGGNIVIIEENSCDVIPAQNPEQLFERFFRGDAARTQQTDKSGYGIGLSIARMICENLHGSLQAEYPEPGLIRFTVKMKLIRK